MWRHLANLTVIITVFKTSDACTNMLYSHQFLALKIVSVALLTYLNIFLVTKNFDELANELMICKVCINLFDSL